MFWLGMLTTLIIFALISFFSGVHYYIKVVRPSKKFMRENNDNEKKSR